MKVTFCRAQWSLCTQCFSQWVVALLGEREWEYFLFLIPQIPGSRERSSSFFFFFPYFLASDIESQLLPVLMFHKGTGAQLCALAWPALRASWASKAVRLCTSWRKVETLICAASRDIEIQRVVNFCFSFDVCALRTQSYCLLAMYENSISRCKHNMLKSLMQRAHGTVNHS